MKKFILSLTFMFALLFSFIFVSAATYTYVSDNATYSYNSSNYATAVLSGRFNDSTDKLSNVSTSKTEVGKVTASFGTINRGTYSASVKVRFYYNGTYKKTYTLSI